jgi:uncharacterized protein (DUF1778 family)
MALLMVSGSESAGCKPDIFMRDKTHTDFILDATRRATDETLFDQVRIVTSRETYSEFLTRLEQPPQPNEHLRNTMRTPVPWDKA